MSNSHELRKIDSSSSFGGTITRSDVQTGAFEQGVKYRSYPGPDLVFRPREPTTSTSDPSSKSDGPYSMSKSFVVSAPKIPASQLPTKSAWAKGPPQSASPRSQFPAPSTPAPVHATHSRRPSTLGQGIPIKDGVSIPRNNVGATKTPHPHPGQQPDMQPQQMSPPVPMGWGGYYALITDVQYGMPPGMPPDSYMYPPPWGYGMPLAAPPAQMPPPHPQQQQQQHPAETQAKFTAAKKLHLAKEEERIKKEQEEAERKAKEAERKTKKEEEERQRIKAEEEEKQRLAEEERIRERLERAEAFVRVSLISRTNNGTATIRKPPHMHHFDHLHSNSKGSMSPLERCINASCQCEISSAPTIISEIHLLSEFDSRSAPTSTASTSRLLPPTVKDSEKLLISGPLGPDMDVLLFCTQFELDDNIIKHLISQGYKKTKTFRYITIEGLKEMSFKPGEIALLQVAVAEWAGASE
ncbi:hypothetical protein BT96DRAFT_969013 [Gymnopus androsaceus JB14]|uniref:Uncharacterized protein n=1 Tax=Gymnopus androsaceus JB14 TaxID=1447944 RepID=A0A6A4ISX2_9AGAR|nr:hypothetical protein BT96DRAFT_969013 [Gymnopus androsaceus JB14]